MGSLMDSKQEDQALKETRKAWQGQMVNRMADQVSRAIVAHDMRILCLLSLNFSIAKFDPIQSSDYDKKS